MAGGRSRTTAELMADEAAEQAAVARASAAWREAVLEGARWPEVPEGALTWLREREPDPDRASLVLLAWSMGAAWPR